MNNTPHRQIGCGCCTGDIDGPKDFTGLAADRCTCHIHQDAPRGILPKACSRHDQLVQQWQQSGVAAARGFILAMENTKPLHHYSSMELCEYEAAKAVAQPQKPNAKG